MPLADPYCDAVAIGAVVTRSLTLQPNLSYAAFRNGVEYSLDFALRALGSDRRR